MQAFRNPTGTIRTLNILVLGFFVTTFYAPSALAMKNGIDAQEKRALIEASLPENQSDTAKYTATLKRMKGHLSEAERLYNEQKDSLIGQTDIDNAIDNGGSLFQKDERWKTELNLGLTLASEAIALNKSVDSDFRAVKDWIKAKELPNIFTERHREAYSDYEERYNAFLTKLKPLRKAANKDEEGAQIAALKNLNTYLKDQQFGRKHQEFDGETMGNSAPVSAEGKPLLLTQSDYFRAGAQSNPQMQIAALGDFDFSQLPGADDPAFLAETDEVVLTQSVRDQAAELDHDPVKIYHWVRNNIETLPGWGSYQNAELTLGARRGNSFDVASLLIALLRASEIPARYVMGVAEIDAARYTNWLGNFDNADVASNYATQNGIAVQIVTSGGEITKVRTQHMWVQAAIDYFPSRGAKNRSADSWLDLDTSFKQYEYQEGLDVLEVTGIDAEALAYQFTSSGTVDEDAGFVQNLDPTELLAAQEQAQAQLEDYIENNLTDPTVGDVIGGRRTIVKDYPALASGLPYTKFNQGATYGAIPSGLQNKVSIGFNNNRVTFPFARVNNEKVTLQFTPATEADEDALTALLPEGEITDVSQLPNNIPAYLARVIPEISLNGELILQDSAMSLGSEVNLTYQISGPLTTYAPYNYSVIAGSYLNVPLVAQSVNPKKLEDSLNSIEAMRDILVGNDQNRIETLSRDEILGDLFYVGGLSYFSQYIGLSHMAALQNQGSHKLEFGYGSYGYEPNLDSFFGIARGIETGIAALNILFANTVEDKNGDLDTRVQLRFQTGLISSALEHAMPEQMFSDSSNPTDGMSAIKALQLAAQEGQKIHQIDSNNVNSVLAQVEFDSMVEDEIRTYVRGNRIAIAHDRNVSVPGWNGVGYILLDQETGIGSYKISGGGNGGTHYLSAFGGASIFGLTSIVSVAKWARFAGYAGLVTASINPFILLALALAVTVAAIAVAISDDSPNPELKRFEDFIESMVTIASIGAAGVIFLGGFAPALALLLMVAMIGRLLAYELIINRV